VKAFLELCDLVKRFGTGAPVVDGFSLALQRGELVSLLGHSGCGKSTVLSMVAGLLPIDGGGVILDGREIDGPGTDRGVVFQAPSLLPWLTAEANVQLAVDRARMDLPRAARRDLARAWLARVDLAGASDRRAAQLSLGMRQRVGIARALAIAPKLLLLDEPFGMLDSLTRLELQEVLLEVWGRERCTALLVTHDVDEALFLSDRIALMTKGPRARLAAVFHVPFERPRERSAVLEHPEYYALRERLLGALAEQEHAPEGRSAA
jgi:nitrate/nitrite transport system ATP-binding protein